MTTEKPKVTVAMAVYKPNADWFIKQLVSIDRQDYSSVELLIWNDSPREFECHDIAAKYIQNIPYKILDNGKNNGVTKAFENLTQCADGKYIAYSDQDDIWMPNKISLLVDFMEKNPDCVCCHSDVELINEKDEVARKSIYPDCLEVINTKKYQKKIFLVKNWNVGCAMMMNIQAAKAAIPFPVMVYHDQWLEMVAIALGKFCYVESCLIKHRIHGTNNSQTLNGIHTKRDYYNIKLARDVDFFKFIREKLPSIRCETEGKWIEAREQYSRNCNIFTFFTLLSLWKIRPTITLFELILPLVPNKLFSKIVESIQKEVRLLGYR